MSADKNQDLFNAPAVPAMPIVCEEGVRYVGNFVHWGAGGRYMGNICEKRVMVLPIVGFRIDR